MELITQIVVVALMVVMGIILFRTTKFEMKTQIITTVALLMVIAIVLGTSFLTISIPIFGPHSFEIKFDTLPIMFIGLLFGPAWGFIAGITTDLLQLLLTAPAFPFFGFTLNLALTGVFSGLIFSQHNKLNSTFILRITQLFLAVLGVGSLLFIGSADSIRLSGSDFVLTIPIKLILGLVLFSLTFVLIYYLNRYVGHIEDRNEKDYVAKFTMVVVLCEVIIQMMLTSLWLSVLFKLPWLVYMAPRIVEAVPMIFIYVFIGHLLYRILFKRFIKPKYVVEVEDKEIEINDNQVEIFDDE